MRKPCCDNKHTNKGAWTKQEDQMLVNYIRTHGEGCWRTLPKQAGLHRCGKSCRLRWTNYLRPDIKRGNFAEDEEDLIVKLHALLGNRWSLIAGRLPGRTDNEVKNYWNSHLRRKLMSRGIDPNNHRLNQIRNLHHRQSENENQNRQPSPGSKSSGSKIINCAASKSLDDQGRIGDDDEEVLSDAATSHDDETLCSSHLNLDLTIGFPSSFPSCIMEEKVQQNTPELHMNKEAEGDQTPTGLDLFL